MMSWLERVLLRRKAIEIAEQAEERHKQAYKDLDDSRLDFYEIRGRLLAKVGDSCRPVSIPDIEVDEHER